MKLGITIQSLENSYWAGVFGKVEKLMEEKGWEASVVDCKDNSAQQISQIENFVMAVIFRTIWVSFLQMPHRSSFRR